MAAALQTGGAGGPDRPCGFTCPVCLAFPRAGPLPHPQITRREDQRPQGSSPCLTHSFLVIPLPQKHTRSHPPASETFFGFSRQGFSV